MFRMAGHLRLAVMVGLLHLQYNIDIKLLKIDNQMPEFL